jgi:hypothetical protein
MTDEQKIKNEQETGDYIRKNLNKACELLGIAALYCQMDSNEIDRDGKPCVTLTIDGMICVFITYRFCTDNMTIAGSVEVERMVFDLYPIITERNYPDAPDITDIGDTAFDTCFRPLDVVESILNHVRRKAEKDVMEHLEVLRIGQENLEEIGEQNE